jgi:creatinine amidohydrolase
MKLKSHWWWDYSSREFSELDMESVVAILPVGAVEQHGPHLPVSVDAAINAGIIQRATALMPDDLPVLVLPMMPIGKSNEHLAFPGTLTLSFETLANLWIEIGESVRRAGARRIIIFNSHGGQPQVADIVCRELRVRHGMFAVTTMWSKITPVQDLFDGQELKHGIHAGEVETSIMLHLHRNLVDMERAGDFVPLSVHLENELTLLTPEGGVGFGWQAQDLHLSGACGNAAAADGDRGTILVDRAAAALVRLAREVADYPLNRITQDTIYR